MHSFEACSDAKDIVRLFTGDLQVDGFLMGKHVKLDRVAKATEQGFIAGCCEYIGDIPDTVAQTSAVTEAALSTESIDSMVKQLKKLEPSRLQEGVRA